MVPGFRIVAMASVLAAVTATATAAPVPVGDASVEGNALGPGNWSNNLGPEWQVTGEAFEEYIFGFAADGTDHLGVAGGSDVWQDLGIVYQPGTLYTLTVAAGHRGGYTSPGNQTTYALADSTGIIYASAAFDASTIAQGSFTDAPQLEFASDSIPAAAGRPIRVLLMARGPNRSHFDDVRLDAVDLAPGGGATVRNDPATAIGATTATLHGEVTDIGSAAPIIAIFLGDEDGGIDPAAWDRMIPLAGTHSGPFSTVATGLAPGTAYYFAARATNISGNSWALPAGSFVTQVLPASVVNVAAGDIAATTATVGATVTDSGGDPPVVTIHYGTADGGTDEESWQHSRSLGVVGGTVAVPLTGLAGETSYHFRARASNGGGESWAPSSATFTTLPVTPPVVINLPANGITGTSANLRGAVTDDGLEAPVVTIHYGTTDGGAGGTWDASFEIGAQGGGFSRFVGGLSPQTTYYFTAQATNSAGTDQASPSGSFTTTAEIPGEIVINEIHYDPEPKTEPAEFIELYNPGAATVNLSGWRFSDGVDYTIPAGTMLGPDSYLVVAADPATIAAKFGVAALGPWSGALDNDGERVELVDASGVVQDEVDYGVGFPWPTGSLDSGRSIELVHPALDNDLGGHWRVAGDPAGSGGAPVAPESEWKFHRGITEPSAVTGEWRYPGFDDSGWEDGVGTIGYGEGILNTILGDMQGSYSTVYLRHEFQVGDPGMVPSLVLRARYDDGFNAWINGVHVASDNVAGENLGHTATASSTRENLAYDEFTLPDPQSFLVSGTNVIAVQLLNVSLAGSSDAFWDAELVHSSGGFSGISPGGFNGSFASAVPPAIRQVDHLPLQPSSGDPVLVTAKVTDPDGVGQVSLFYQVVEPGQYIRLGDAAYEDPVNWTELPMVDDGSGDDLFAGDAVFSAAIPSAVQQHRRLVRYRITVEDVPGSSVQVPYADDPQPNFAYFVYDGVPAWSGQVRPSSGDPSEFGPALLESVPVYHLITRREDHEDAQHIPDATAAAYGGSDYPWLGTLVYDGEVYDHIRYRARGGVWRYSMGKNMWKFKFHDGHGFRARDSYGREYPDEWRRLNFSAIICQGDFGQRGEQGLYEGAGFRLFELAGVEAPATHHVHFRIVENAQQTGADQYSGDFQGLYLVVEQPDGRFLDTHDMPECNIFKMEGGTGVGGIGGELKYQAGPELPADSSDLIEFKTTYEGGAQSEGWWRDNLDLEKYYSYRTIVDAVHHYDIGAGKNYYYFHNAETGRWQVHPWDMDLTWDDGAHGDGNEPFRSRVLTIPQFDLEHQNRAREVLDLLFNPDQARRVIEEVAGFVHRDGEASLVDADRMMWDYNPILVSQYVNSSKAGHGLFYRGAEAPGGFAGMMAKMAGYVAERKAWIENNTLDLAVPARPVITYSGESGFPATGLRFQSSEFAGSGMLAEAIEWRIGEVYDPVNVPAAYVDGTPYVYEIEPLWRTGALPWGGGAVEQAVPAGVTVPGRSYRARVRHRSAAGLWSSWSEPVEFVAGQPDVGPYQAGLVVTEVLYHPRDASPAEIAAGYENTDFEFIELCNVGPVPLDLSAVRFTDGIEYAFDGAAITMLAPGERVLVVADLAAFESRYGSGLPVAGEYSAALSNGGERVELSLGTGAPILWFTYDDVPPWPTAADDGVNGFSLLLIDPESVPDHALASSWTAGLVAGGTPGAGEPAGFDHWLAGFGLSGDADEDFDGDLVPALLEYLLAGGNPLVADPTIQPVLGTEWLDLGAGLEPYAIYEVTVRTGLDDVELMVETSPDLAGWDRPGEVVLLEQVDHGDGTATLRFRSAGQVAGSMFFRAVASETE